MQRSVLTQSSNTIDSNEQQQQQLQQDAEESFLRRDFERSLELCLISLKKLKNTETLKSITSFHNQRLGRLSQLRHSCEDAATNSKTTPTKNECGCEQLMTIVVQSLFELTPSNEIELSEILDVVKSFYGGQFDMAPISIYSLW